MSTRDFQRGDGRRHLTDPTSTRFNVRSRFHQRGGPSSRRPTRERLPTISDDLSTMKVSVGLGSASTRTFSHDSAGSRFNRNRDNHSRMINPNRRVGPNFAQTEWWRVSIPQAGSIGKDRVMAALRSNINRHFQPYHYFIDQDTGSGVFFVNSQEEADMLRRSNKKVEIPGHGPLSIMVSGVSSPAPLLDQDLRLHFRDFIINQCFNPQTFQLNLSNLLDNEDLSNLGIFPQLSKASIAREVILIVNKDLQSTRQFDLGSNKISRLHEFRNLMLPNLEVLSLASNEIRSIDELENLKQLPRLTHLFVKENPFCSGHNRRFNSRDELISAIRQFLPQLKRIDDVELPAQIGFGIDQQVVNLPSSVPHCVPQEMHGFLTQFIDEYYRLFDTAGRADLQACYHENCFLSICISPTESSIVPTRSFRFGALIYDSRNLKKLSDENKRTTLLRTGKSNVLDFLRVKFPQTKHEGKSFRVDVISSSANRAIFVVHGLFREVEQDGPHSPVRSFQRAFTCSHTSTGIFIVADHLMIINATEQQYSNLTRPVTSSSAVSSYQQMESQNAAVLNNNAQDLMVLKLSRQSGMNINFSKQCLMEYQWDFDRAYKVFLDLKAKGSIPTEAFQN